MRPGAKNCCSPDGHCKTKTKKSQSSNREYNKIAFDHHKTVDLPTEFPIVAVVKIVSPVHAVDVLDRRHGANLIGPSPPDLQVLHSVFLI
jgi:hypothetical protein